MHKDHTYYTHESYQILPQEEKELRKVKTALQAKIQELLDGIVSIISLKRKSELYGFARILNYSDDMTSEQFVEVAYKILEKPLITGCTVSLSAYKREIKKLNKVIDAVNQFAASQNVSLQPIAIHPLNPKFSIEPPQPVMDSKKAAIRSIIVESLDRNAAKVAVEKMAELYGLALKLEQVNISTQEFVETAYAILKFPYINKYMFHAKIYRREIKLVNKAINRVNKLVADNNLPIEPLANRPATIVYCKH